MKNHIKNLTALCAVALSALLTSQAKAVDVVVSIPELGAIAKDVGGSHVEVYSVAQPGRDYHTIEARPSDVARVARAGLVVRSGLGLDVWMDALMIAAKRV